MVLLCLILKKKDLKKTPKIKLYLFGVMFL